MAWSGLWDGVHGDPHALINGDPPGIKRLNLLMQRRGNYGIAKANGGTVPATRHRTDYTIDIPSERNYMLIPGTATDGRNPPTRDIAVNNALGMVRVGSDDATPSQVSSGTHLFGNDTRLNWAYAADLSGNGAPGFAPGVPNTPPHV